MGHIHLILDIWLQGLILWCWLLVLYLKCNQKFIFSNKSNWYMKTQSNWWYFASIDRRSHMDMGIGTCHLPFGTERMLTHILWIQMDFSVVKRANVSYVCALCTVFVSSAQIMHSWMMMECYVPLDLITFLH